MIKPSCGTVALYGLFIYLFFLEDHKNKRIKRPSRATVPQLDKTMKKWKKNQKDAKWFCCSSAEFTKCKFISLSGMFNEMKLISPRCLKYVVIT